jgi:hypothetical protein
VECVSIPVVDLHLLLRAWVTPRQGYARQDRRHADEGSRSYFLGEDQDPQRDRHNRQKVRYDGGCRAFVGY